MRAETMKSTPNNEESKLMMDIIRKKTSIVFPAGNPDFREVRNRCAKACREFNNTPEDADPEVRTRKWLDIVRPDRDRSKDRTAAVTHDQTFANPNLQAKTPFVKPPFWADYGVRLKVGGSTFINRDCKIHDTPVADVVIGEGCNIGPNCTIVSVTHPKRLDERLKRDSIGAPITIGNNVFIGANVTILDGVTIGDGAVIGAGSVVKRDIPPMCVAFGNPAEPQWFLDNEKPILSSLRGVRCLKEAMQLDNQLNENVREEARVMARELIAGSSSSDFNDGVLSEPQRGRGLAGHRQGESGLKACVAARLDLGRQRSAGNVKCEWIVFFLLGMFTNLVLTVLVAGILYRYCEGLGYGGRLNTPGAGGYRREV